MKPKTSICTLTNKPYPLSQMILFADLDDNLKEFLQKQFPSLSANSLIGRDQIPLWQRQQVAQLLSDDAGELSTLQQEVLDSVQSNHIYTDDIEENIEQQRSFGERVADSVASFGGSWTFIIWFFALIVIWMVINIIGLGDRGFDPYPFILLNLILSCLAAIQAPIIMMSQNRKEANDRMRSEHDYKINLKAELEIKLLHKKLDYLMAHHNQRLLDIQQVQTDMLSRLIPLYEKASHGSSEAAKLGQPTDV